ncbi:MAG: 5'-deoxyadenosine deaminase [Pyrinomonadaceae bacterium]
MTKTILIKGGTLVTMDAGNAVLEGDLLVRDGRIVRVGTGHAESADVTIDARDCAVLPGFVQTHIHLCQTIFRGSADDLQLIDWLKRRVWPLEAAHTRESVRASARLGVAELMKGGTTCALTMETVSHTEEVFRVVEETGFRATVGKCMMDRRDGDTPLALQEETEASISESLMLLEKWHGRADGRIRYCFAPRFAISCTRELLGRVAELARERGAMVHTHASENRNEIQLIEQETGQRNVEYLDSIGISGPHVLLAHCVHVNDDEMTLLSSGGTHVAHCPSSNLKLGSGIAPVTGMLERGISVSIGADGAACNNRLDMFTEMRTAALLQKVTCGTQALPAQRVLRMATIDGAHALGLGSEIGSLETGKRADITIINLNRPHLTPRADVISTLVYAAEASDVRTVLIDGETVLLDGELQTLNESEVMGEANSEWKLLKGRAGI